MRNTIFLVILLVLFLCACSQGDDKLLDNGDSGGNSDGDADSDTDADSDADADADGDSDGDVDTINGNDTSCGSANINFSMDIPTVILLVDQSGSMIEDFGNTDRWNAVKTTLVNEDDGLVKNLESQIRFGLQLYTSTDAIAAAGNCPVLTGVEAEVDNYSSIFAVYDDPNNEPVEDTPTGESVDAVVEILKADNSPGNKIIVLATDGMPDTCDIPDPDNQEETNIANQQSIDSVTAAFNAGFPVYVISVGTQVSEEHLAQLANVGQGYDIDDPDGAIYYMGTDATSLENAFSNIVQGIRDCVLRLNGRADESLIDECRVTIDGNPVDYQSDDGWRLNNPGEMELLGASCESIQEGDVNVSVSCPCNAVIVV